MHRQKKHATVNVDSGENYREIAELMTMVGHPMNHSSARNHVIRVMRKFVLAIAKSWGTKLSDADIERIARDPQFQSEIGHLVQKIELTH
jgi:hypothetical protein